MNAPSLHQRPKGVTAVSVFLFFGAIVSGVATASLLRSGSWLEPMWRLHERARAGFDSMGAPAIALLAVVSIACLIGAVGLWLGRRWGYLTAVGIFVFNLLGDLANSLTGTEPRAIIGVPITAAILWYLSTRAVRDYFSPRPQPNTE